MHICSLNAMAPQKVVVKIMTMNDIKTQQKAMEAVAAICGITRIEANLKEQKLTVIGEMDAVDVPKRLIKRLGKVVELFSVGPAAAAAAAG